MMLRPKMFATLLPPLIIIVGILIFFSQQRLHENARFAAYAEAQSILLTEAQSFAETFNKAYATANSLALQMAEIKKTGNIPRQILSDMLNAQMQANKQYFGIWTMWEPNAFDGKDAETPQSDTATETGAINIYWTWEGPGRLVSVPGEDAMRNEPYYTAPQKAQRAVFPPIYFDESTNQYTSTVSAPIMDGSKFLGAVGVDQTLEAIQKRIATIHPYGTGYAMIFAPDGTILAAPDAGLIGKPMPENTPQNVREAILGRKPLRIGGVSSFTNEDMLTVYDHISVADGATTWCFAVSVPAEKILAQNNAAIRIMLAVGVLGLLIITGIVVVVISSVVKALQQGVDYARAVADGNLDARYETNRVDEIGILAGALSSMVLRMRETLNTAEGHANEAELAVRKSEKALQDVAERAKAEEKQREGMLAVAAELESIVGNLGKAAGTLAGQVQQAVSGAKNTLTQSEQSAAAVQELDSAAGEMARNAEEAANFAEQAQIEAGKGTKVMNEVVDSVGKINTTSLELKKSLSGLGEQVEGIGNIMNVISDIADQTNLLALNAAIEAARAGDSGRGFAVVADEVRKLAERTMQATGEVAKVVGSIQNGTRATISEMDKAVLLVETSTDLANKTGAALTEIENLVHQSATRVVGITAASQEQSSLSGTIRASAETVKDIAGETANAMQVSALTVAELTDITKKLTELTASLRKQ